MNFLGLSQILGLAGSPQGVGSTAQAGQASGQQTGGFTTLLQAMGFSAEAGADAFRQTNATAQQAVMPDHTKPALQDSVPNMQPGLDAQATVAAATVESGAMPSLPPGLTDQLNQLAALMQGEGTEEELAAFAASPLGRLLASQPEIQGALRDMLAQVDESGFDPSRLTLPDSLAKDERSAITALVAALNIPVDAATAPAPVMATGPDALSPITNTSPLSQQTAPLVEDAGSDAVQAVPDRPATAGTPDKMENAPLKIADWAAGTGNAIAPSPKGESVIAARQEPDRTAATSHEEAADPDFPRLMIDPVAAQAPGKTRTGPGASPAQAGISAQAGNTATGEAASTVAENRAKAGADPALDRGGEGATRQPARTTAFDVLAALRTDWGSGVADGWFDPLEGSGTMASQGSLAASALTAASTSKAGLAAAQSAAQGAHVAGQVAVQIGRAVENGNDSFKIRLDPPELGRIDVKLDIAHDGRVTAVLAVDNDKTLQLLLRDQGVLERALQDAGLKTDSGSLNFSLNGRDDGERRQDHAGTSSGNHMGSMVETADLPPPVVLSNRVLDLRV